MSEKRCVIKSEKRLLASASLRSSSDAEKQGDLVTLPWDEELGMSGVPLPLKLWVLCIWGLFVEEGLVMTLLMVFGVLLLLKL